MCLAHGGKAIAAGLPSRVGEEQGERAGGILFATVESRAGGRHAVTNCLPFRIQQATPFFEFIKGNSDGLLHSLWF